VGKLTVPDRKGGKVSC